MNQKNILNHEKIKAILREKRLAKDLTQEAVAERAGLSREHVCSAEGANGKPGITTIQRIARAIGIPFAIVLNGEKVN